MQLKGTRSVLLTLVEVEHIQVWAGELCTIMFMHFWMMSIANSLKPTSIYDFKLKTFVKMCLFALNFLCGSCSESFQAHM